MFLVFCLVSTLSTVTILHFSQSKKVSEDFIRLNEQERHQGLKLLSNKFDDQMKQSFLQKANDSSLMVHHTSQLTLMAVGDIMMHSPQIKAGQTKDGYNFSPFFKEVQPILSQGDVVIGNLETTLSGPKLGYAGYPLFNSPDPLADAIKKAGFTFLTTANNHSLDYREYGLVRTIEQLERVGLPSTGTSRTLEERNQIKVIEKNKIKIAVLAYTYGTNGIPRPNGKEYMVNVWNEELAQQDVLKAKQMGVDLIIVALHYGGEYQPLPNNQQRKIADQLFSWGADIILGSHPHVLQPYEWREVLTEDGELKKGFVIYSLGNFISNQRTVPRDIGGILKLKIVKKLENTQIEEVSFIPTWVHVYWKNRKLQYRILPMEAVTQTGYEKLSKEMITLLKTRLDYTIDHINKFTSVKASGEGSDSEDEQQ